MTPKEKANELTNRFIDHVKWNDRGYKFEESKMCANICVNEILTQLNKMESKDLSDLQYWTEVECELSLL